MSFKEVYLSHVLITDFRKNPRSELGTRTATLDRDGVKKLRANWIYRLYERSLGSKSRRAGIARAARSK